MFQLAGFIRSRAAELFIDFDSIGLPIDFVSEILDEQNVEFLKQLQRYHRDVNARNKTVRLLDELLSRHCDWGGAVEHGTQYLHALGANGRETVVRIINDLIYRKYDSV